MPIWIGASGPAATRLAGRIADGFITTSGKADTLYRDTLLPALSEGAGKAGRTLGDLDLMIEMKVSYDHDKERALADTKNWAALALSPEEKTHVEDPIEMQRLADALPVERAASRWIVSDDPDEHVEKVKHYIDLGLQPPGVPRPGRRIRPGSWSSTGPRCSRSCGRWTRRPAPQSEVIGGSQRWDALGVHRRCHLLTTVSLR